MLLIKSKTTQVVPSAFCRGRFSGHLRGGKLATVKSHCVDYFSGKWREQIFQTKTLIVLAGEELGWVRRADPAGGWLDAFKCELIAGLGCCIYEAQDLCPPDELAIVGQVEVEAQAQVQLQAQVPFQFAVMLVPLSAPWNFYDLPWSSSLLCFSHFLPGPRTRKPKKPATSSAAAGGGGGAGGGGVGGVKGEATDGGTPEDKRPRTAFSGTQLARLKVRIITVNVLNI